jgi:hypothetical protein
MNGLPGSIPKLDGSILAPMDTASLCGIICECVQRACVTEFGDRLRAIVLTGSMARSEASFAHEEDYWVVSGDAEFLVVFEKGLALPSAAALQTIRQRIEGNLRQHKIRCIVDLSAVRLRYFRHLPPHIFSYELKHCGRVIWGDARILQLIPDFSVDELSLEDAWRLLCNRMIELLECAPELSSGGNPPSAKLHYRTLKLYLDMATSLLIFLRAYAPTFQERREILCRLADHGARPEEYPFELKSFSDRVAQCTDQKLMPHLDTNCCLDLSWRTAIHAAHLLWRWELARLTGVKKALSDRELFDKWRRRQPLGERVRGWLYVLRALGWHRSYSYWHHWVRFSWKASPRCWIYLVASNLLFQMAKDEHPSSKPQQSVDWVSLGKLLPVRNTTTRSLDPCSWEGLASDVVWNYREFLVGTRAG